MSYREHIIDAIKLHRKGTINGPSVHTIRDHVRANFPSDKKWNLAIFLNELKKMRHDGYLVILEYMHYNFSTTFEKKYLDEEAVAANQERLWVEAAATKLEKTTDRRSQGY